MTTEDLDQIRSIIQDELRSSKSVIVKDTDYLLDIAKDHAAWSQKTFGDDDVLGPQGPLFHLKKNIEKALNAPHDREEYADLFLLVLDASRRAGIDAGELLQEADKKLDKNIVVCPKIIKWEFIFQQPTSETPVWICIATNQGIDGSYARGTGETKEDSERNCKAGIRRLYSTPVEHVRKEQS